MAILTCRSLGGEKKHTHDDGLGNNVAQKNGYERGFPPPPQRWLITAEVRRSMGTKGRRMADKVEDGGEGRRQMEMAGVMEALRVAGAQQKEGRWQGEEGVR